MEVPKPKLYSAPWIPASFDILIPEMEIPQEQGQLLWMRILEAWPFLARQRVKVVLGPDQNGNYTVIRFSKQNGKLHVTISGSNYEQ